MVFLNDTLSCRDLYFLRHGLAGQHGDPKYKDDSLRPLTAQGRNKMLLAAKGMKALDLAFDAILSSPYLRARQTAEIVTQVFKIKNKTIHLTDHLLPPASIKELLRETHACFPKSKNILFVGHEPHLTEMIAHLLKLTLPLPLPSREGNCFNLKKGGLCCINIDRLSTKNPNASLMWLLTSSQLGLMAR